MFNAIIPIIKKYHKKCGKDEFWGFVNSTMSSIYVYFVMNKGDKE